MQIKTTKAIHDNGVKALVYGVAGSGKTTLAKTMPSPLVISAEGGLLALAGTDIPYVEIAKLEDLTEVLAWLQSDESADIKSVMLDSISEISEVCLTAEKSKTRDGRAAYGALAELMRATIRKFRDLPNRHVLMIAKADCTEGQYAPSMPGKTLTQDIPYFFDLVLALRIERDADGNTKRALQAKPDGIWAAKDRSGKLPAFCPPDFSKLIEVITHD